MGVNKIILVNATGIDLTYRGFVDNMITPRDLQLKLDMMIRPENYKNFEPYKISDIDVPATLLCDKWTPESTHLVFMVDLRNFRGLQDSNKHIRNLAHPLFVGHDSNGIRHPFNAFRFVDNSSTSLYHYNGHWYIPNNDNIVN